MTQIYQQQIRPPRSPRLAVRRRAPLDKAMDVDFFKALADPTRALLLACLVKCTRPCSVTEVAECCSVDFSVVARHLATLARAGVLEVKKEGRTVWYTARGGEICSRLRALADAIETWETACRGSACACAEEKGAGCDDH